MVFGITPTHMQRKEPSQMTLCFRKILELLISQTVIGRDIQNSSCWMVLGGNHNLGLRT